MRGQQIWQYLGSQLQRGITMAEPPSPAARRLRRPSWLDLRLVIGVLLVLVSIVVGARVVAGADKSTTVWGLARDVSAGTTLTADDLRRVRVRLYDDASSFVSTGRSPLGQVVTRDLASGDLLPESALQQRTSGVLLPLAVDPQMLPPDIQHGDRIDVYVGSGTGESETFATTPVLVNATVQSISNDANGALGDSGAKVQLTVQVSEAQEAVVVPDIAQGTLYVVKRVGAAARGPTSTHPSGAVPTSTPTAAHR